MRNLYCHIAKSACVKLKLGSSVIDLMLSLFSPIFCTKVLHKDAHVTLRSLSLHVLHFLRQSHYLLTTHVCIVNCTHFHYLSSIAVDALTQVFPVLNQNQNIGSQKHEMMDVTNSDMATKCHNLLMQLSTTSPIMFLL